MHEGSVPRSLAIIYEFGAPKKATAAVAIADVVVGRIAASKSGASRALRISNRSASRIKYFMENAL